MIKNTIDNILPISDLNKIVIDYFAGCDVTNNKTINLLGADPYIKTPNMYLICKGNNTLLFDKYLGKDKIAKQNIIKGFNGACAGGHIDLIKKILQLDGHVDFQHALMFASEHNQMQVIEFIFDKITDFGFGLHGASRGNNVVIMKYMIEHGAINIENSLFVACIHNSIDAVKFILSIYKNEIQLGTSLYAYMDYLSTALYHACYYNHIEIIDILLKFGTNDYNSGLDGACEKGHMDLAKYMISLGANNYNLALRKACSSGNIKLVRYIVELGGGKFERGMYNAAVKNHKDIVDYMIELGARDYNTGLAVVCINGSLEMAKYMVKKGANNFNEGLKNACRHHKFGIIKFLVEQGANNFNEGLKYLFDYGILLNSENVFYFIKYLINKGANNIEEAIKLSKKIEADNITNYMLSV